MMLSGTDRTEALKKALYFVLPTTGRVLVLILFVDAYNMPLRVTVLVTLDRDAASATSRHEVIKWRFFRLANDRHFRVGIFDHFAVGRSGLCIDEYSHRASAQT
jgi:hypothetical protein